MRPVLLFFLTLSLLAHASLISHDHGLIARRDHSQLARRTALSKRCTTNPSPSPAPQQPAPPAPPNNNNVLGAVLTVQSTKCGPNGATSMF
jgi:hypothetical protein